MSTKEILQAYRQLYRAGLHAVRHSRPARFEVRDILREAFRTQPATAFSPRRIQNTVRFLENAGAYTGFEHRILKNLLHLKFWQIKGLDKQMIRVSNSGLARETRRNFWQQYRATLTMLNESLDTCLQLGAENP